jgi:UDP-N-acetylmuramoyl-L-alanyl-D-glutamate--2,6-diaminopimelate ligase
MAAVAATIYGRPADALTMCAVTGTNGKTTTTFLLEAALRADSVNTGLVGTVGFRLNGEPLDCVPTTVTTPESTDLQALLAFLVEEGAETVVMEVSSHALVLGRTEAITFDVAAFTNLGRDHLDFHANVESYFEAKASLFSPERTKHAVINVDDPRGRELVQRIGRRSGIGLTTVSLDGDAACRALGYRVQPDGRTAVRADVRGRILDFSLNLPGEFNIRNALTALAMVDAIEGDLDRAAIGLARLRLQVGCSGSSWVRERHWSTWISHIRHRRSPPALQALQPRGGAGGSSPPIPTQPRRSRRRIVGTRLRRRPRSSETGADGGVGSSQRRRSDCNR